MKAGIKLIGNVPCNEGWWTTHHQEGAMGTQSQLFYDGIRFGISSPPTSEDRGVMKMEASRDE